LICNHVMCTNAKPAWLIALSRQMNRRFSVEIANETTREISTLF
jgi:hypothetical protein